MELKDFLRNKKWKIVDIQKIPPREAKYYGYNDLGLSLHSIDLLKNDTPKGIYLHQKEAIKEALKGENICLTTGTASGKSLVFYISGIEKIKKQPNSKIIAIYPLRALGKEQEERWKRAFNKSNLDVAVGRIDGQVPIHERTKILISSQLLVLTPDIIHAWLLYNLSSKAAIDFFKDISLIVVDEVHNYTGVFGSNSAYLFRRMQHIVNSFHSSPQYIAASATIANPEVHLQNLIGVHFKLIDSSYDSSPKQEIEVKLIETPMKYRRKIDLLTPLTELIEGIVKSTDHRFICFVDSRKQTEYISSIIARSQIKEDIEENLDYSHLQNLNVLPYRAGYELEDRNTIQERLSKGTLRGVISTSALELGLDIPFLDFGILVGVPRSSTTLYQRIGRIGRHAKGEVLIINTGDVYSDNIFRNPKQLLKMPFSEGALYLENKRIQYIHALCLARQGGEYDQLCSFLNKEESLDFETPVNWPIGFLELCEAERRGLISPELQNIKAQAGDDPNHLYPLRDIDVQFKVEYKSGPRQQSLGSLTYGQLMREAYPGAVYYYTTKTYRVYRVKIHSRIVEVRYEKKYTTTPNELPTLVFPNLSQGNIYKSYKFGQLIVAECNLQVRQVISGFKEKRGPNELDINYPLDPTLGLYFDQPRFTRNFFTTGVVFFHPELNKKDVRPLLIADILFKSFLIVIPFEERDIGFASDKNRTKTGKIKEGARFFCIYDQTYGSLRLSSRLLEERVLKQIFNKAVELAKDRNFGINRETCTALEKIEKSLSKAPVEYGFEMGAGLEIDTKRYIKVIMPGSKGVAIHKDNEEFFVDGIFFNPSWNALAYRGKYLSEKISGKSDGMLAIHFDVLKEIPGESKFGIYDYETGEIKEIK